MCTGFPSAAWESERPSVSYLCTWPHFLHQANHCRECQLSLCSWSLICLITSPEVQGSLSPGSLWILQTCPLFSLPLGTRDLSSFGESLWQRGLAQCQVVMVSRSTGLYLTSYICCPNSLAPTQPLPPPACPAHHWVPVVPAHPNPAVQLWSGPQAIFCLVPKIIQLSGMCV